MTATTTRHLLRIAAVLAVLAAAGAGACPARAAGWGGWLEGPRAAASSVGTHSSSTTDGISGWLKRTARARLSPSPPPPPPSKRELKEAFVSFNNGTTFFEVSAITNAVPLGVAARGALHTFRRALDTMRNPKSSRGAGGGSGGGRDGFSLRDALWGHVADFVCIVLPALAAMLAPRTALPLIAGLAYAVIQLGLGAAARRGGDGASSSTYEEEASKAVETTTTTTTTTSEPPEANAPLGRATH